MVSCASLGKSSVIDGCNIFKALNVSSQYSSSVFDSLHARPVCHELAELPSLEELTKAITHLSNKKAPGDSGILPEMVKKAGPAFDAALLTLTHTAWRAGCVPQAWRDADLVPVPKKGDLSVCDNWRGIALLDVVGKVVGRVFQSRLQRVVKLEVLDSQCGFQADQSCTDHIFNVMQLVEKFYEHRMPGFFIFIDLRKAYDFPVKLCGVALRSSASHRN